MDFEPDNTVPDETKIDWNRNVKQFPLLDEFAKAAMIGLLANAQTDETYDDEDIARLAYQQAHAMLDEREKIAHQIANAILDEHGKNK